MGKGPSVSRELAEMGRHGSGGGPRHHCQRAGIRARAGVREGLGEQATPEWGLGRLAGLPGREGMGGIPGRGPTPASACKERQVCGSLQSMLKREVGVEDQAEPDPEAAPRPHEGTRVSLRGATETGFFRSSATGMVKTPVPVWRVD